MKKRILSLLLAILMAFTAMPTSVFANGTVTYTADYAANKGGTAQFNPELYTEGAYGSAYISDVPSEGLKFTGEYYLNSDELATMAELQMVIEDCYIGDGGYWYKVKAAEGHELPAKLAAKPWVYQNDDPNLYGSRDALIVTPPVVEPTEPTEPTDPVDPSDPETPDLLDKITVEGIPEGAVVEAEDLSDTADSNSDIGIYDIKVRDENGNYWQPTPGETVKVTIPAPAGAEKVTVVHFLEDPEIIKYALENDLAQTADLSMWVNDPNYPIFAAAVAAYQTAMGTMDTFVAVEGFKDVPVIDGKATVNANGFSIFEIQEGSDPPIYIEINETDITELQNKTVYVRKGEWVRITVPDVDGFWDAITQLGNAFSFGNKVPVDNWWQDDFDEWSDETLANNVIILKQEDGGFTDREFYFQVKETATAGSFDVRFSALLTRRDVSFVIVDDFDYGNVYIGVVRHDRPYPNEVSVHANAPVNYYYTSAGLDEDRVVYSLAPNSLIDIDSLSESNELRNNATETTPMTVYGIRDTSGVLTNAFFWTEETTDNQDLNPVFFSEISEDIMDVYFAQHPTLNKENYRLVPYVIKHETIGNNVGWYINCKIELKDTYLLKYDYNFPQGFDEFDLMPKDNPVTKPQDQSIPTHGQDGSELSEVTATVTSGAGMSIETYLPSYGVTAKAEFKGWNTDYNADPSTYPNNPVDTDTWYAAGETITLDGNTTLYAIWELKDWNYPNSVLTISNTIVDSSSNPVTAGNTDFFYSIVYTPVSQNFPVQYKLFDSAGQLIGTYSLEGSDGAYTFTMKGNQYIEIEGVPNNRYTVTQDYPVTGYTCAQTVFALDSETSNKSGRLDANFVNTQILYTITYDLDNGTVDGTNPVEYTVESGEITLMNPTKVGYTFAGWTGTGLTEATMTVTISAGSTGNRQYTATWTANSYNVQFNANGGNGTVGNQSFTYDVKQALDANTFTRTGYKFIGWNTAANGSGTSYADKVEVENLTATANGVVTLYAQWQAQYSYKLDFNANIPTAATATVSGMPSTKTQSWCDDTSKTFTWTEVPTLQNYKFLGWATEANATIGNTTKQYTINGTGAQEVTVTLYAIWELDVADYTVEIYREKLGSNEYELVDTKTMSGTIGTTATVNSGTYLVTGFEFNRNASSSSGTITGDGSLVLKLYYDRITYTVTWSANGINTEETYKYGETPSFKGSADKPADAQYTYTFAGWTPAIVAVTGDVTYTATYTSTINEYTITWVDGDGKPIKVEKLAYGTTPAYSGATPTKTATAQYTYTFNQTWSPEIATVTGDATYTAQFSATVNKYTVTWLDEDGTQLKVDNNVPYGDVPTAPADPTKAATAQYTYTFAGWDKNVVAVTGNVTYTATYTATVNEYTITWIVDGNTTEEVYKYGEMPTFKGSTDKAKDAQYTYTFAGWDKEIVEVTGTATYTAQYNTTVNTYTITWKNYDGTVLEADENVPYGTKVSYDGSTPKRDSTAEWNYVFAGWGFDPNNKPVVEEDLVFTAHYNNVKQRYPVIWKNKDGKELERDENVEFGTMPEYNGETPVWKPEKADGYNYTFIRWSPIISAVDGEATYVAEYEQTAIEYEISYVGTEAGENPVKYTVETETFTLINPTKTGYTFDGWTGTGLTEKTLAVTIPVGSIGNREYTANWTVIEYNISYNLNGGTVNGNNPVKYTVETETFTLINPTKTGYTFDGWTGTDLTEKTLVVTIPTGSIGNRTYTANWTHNTYSIVFDANGGTGEMADLEMIYDNTENLTPNAFERTGYHFVGWKDANGNTYADQAEVKNLVAENDGEITLYAQWEINTFNLFISTHNSIDSNQTYIFTVSGKTVDGREINLTVALGANDWQKIVNLPAGTYTISDQQSWSWRYTSKMVTEDIYSDAVAEFDYTYNAVNLAQNYWLNSYGNELLKVSPTKRKR